MGSIGIFSINFPICVIYSLTERASIIIKVDNDCLRPDSLGLEIN